MANPEDTVFPEFSPWEHNYDALPPGTKAPRDEWTSKLDYAPSAEKDDEMIVFSNRYGSGLYTHMENEEQEHSIEHIKYLYGVMAESGLSTHLNLQRYFGTTPRGFLRLEKPVCRLMEFLKANPKPRMPAGMVGSDKPHFLYYRWIMQFLSALAFLHKHEIIHMGLYLDKLWLRSDLSLVLCDITGASHRGTWGTNYRDPPYKCKYWSGEVFVPWMPENWNYPKHDLFGFGTLLYLILTETEVEEDEDELTPEDEEIAMSLPTGPITKKCWDTEYTNADEVMADLKVVVEAEGIELDDDNQVVVDERGMENLMQSFNAPVHEPSLR